MMCYKKILSLKLPYLDNAERSWAGGCWGLASVQMREKLDTGNSGS